MSSILSSWSSWDPARWSRHCLHASLLGGLLCGPPLADHHALGWPSPSGEIIVVARAELAPVVPLLHIDELARFLVLGRRRPVDLVADVHLARCMGGLAVEPEKARSLGANPEGFE